ncbi:major facilitator superfamily transporter [Colletotrichum higginsianum]|uniref:Major facilitator superfamily transporter n=1 Tax=Colletotrichum higginsianum (strain IMI 349063) TaxID=759273 RepID=H1V4H0_COLHI|nr:major facilitator superfamily transporter [Colletotrichum higginsianum]
MDKPTSCSPEELPLPPSMAAPGRVPEAQSPPLAVADEVTAKEPISCLIESDAEISEKPVADGGSRDAAGDGSALTTDQGDQEEEYITGVRLVLVLAALTFVVFLMLLDMSIITTAIPEITTAFNSLSDVGWYGAAYNLCGAALQPFAGKLYTHLRSKQTFLGFLFVFEVGSLICAVARSSDVFIVGRAIAGMGSAGLFNGALTIIGATVPLQRRPFIVGVLIGVSNLGLVAGPLVGGAFTEFANWRWCFYINLPIGAVVAVLLFLIHIPSKITNPLALSQLPRHLDLPGFALFAPAAIMFLLALQFGGNEHPWDSAVVIGLFVGAGVTAALFLYWERRQGDDKAMIPLGLFRSRIVWASGVVGAFNMSITLVSSYYLPMYFQSVKGATPFQGGVDVLPTILGQLVFAVVSGALVGKLGYYLPWVVFGAVASTIGNGLISTWTPSTGPGRWIGYQVLLGAGRGASMQMHIIAVQANSPPARLSVSMATLVFMQTFAGAIFLTAGEVIFSEGLGNNLAKYAPAVDARTVLVAGGTGFRDVVPEGDLPGVVMAYSKSVSEVFYLLAGLGVVCFGLAWAMGWTDIRKKEAGKKGDV